MFKCSQNKQYFIKSFEVVASKYFTELKFFSFSKQILLQTGYYERFLSDNMPEKHIIVKLAMKVNYFSQSPQK